MTERPAIPSLLEQTRIVAILRRAEPSLAVATTEALLTGGVSAVEVTCNSPGVFGMLRSLASAFGDRILLGAGTVLDRASADQAIDSGAQFIVSPHVDPELIAYVSSRGVPCLPGALTPSEVLTAWRAGASVVKLFPAGPVGPGYLRDLRGPLTEIPFMPTGGVTLDNAEAFVEAGAWGLGLATALVDQKLVNERRFGEITRRARAFVEIAAGARGAA